MTWFYSWCFFLYDLKKNKKSSNKKARKKQIIIFFLATRGRVCLINCNPVKSKLILNINQAVNSKINAVNYLLYNVAVANQNCEDELLLSVSSTLISEKKLYLEIPRVLLPEGSKLIAIATFEHATFSHILKTLCAHSPWHHVPF